MSSQTVGAVTGSRAAPASSAGDDYLRRLGRGGERLGEFGIERLRHDQQPRPAVLEHEAIIVLGQQRVDRHRHHAGLDGAQKGRGPVDGVEQAQQHALFAPQPVGAQHMAETFDPLGQFAVGPALSGASILAVIDEGELAGAPGIDIALEDSGGEIVLARDRLERRPRRRARRGGIHCAFPPLAGPEAAHRRPTLTHYAADGIRPQPRCRTGCQGRRIAL
jgi:hypothetical protein